MNIEQGVKTMWDLVPAWVGTVATWTFIGTIVGIIAGLMTIALSAYKMYLLRKEEKRNEREA